jgi:hypothetical protein
MTAIFIDGFDHYATANIGKKWTTAGASATIGSSGRRSSGNLATASSSSGVVTKTLAATASWVIGFAFQYTGSVTGSASICALLDAGTLQCELRINADGTLSVTRNGSAVTGGTSVTALSAGAYYYLEWKVTIADSIGANSCKVRIGGVDAITVTTGQDLKNTANASANQVRLGCASGTNVATELFDDLYVCDQSGSTNNDFLGDCRVDTLLPTGDGTTSNFTPSTGSAHWSLVDEVDPNTTDYVSSSNSGDIDLYTYPDLTTLVTSTVYGVQVNSAALKDDAGSRSVAVVARSSGSNVAGSTQALSTSQLIYNSIYEADSAAAAWTQTSVNAAEFGVKVAA